MTTNLKSNNNIPLIDVLSSSPTLDKTNVTDNLRPIRDEAPRTNYINDKYDSIGVNPYNINNEGYVDIQDYTNLTKDNSDLSRDFYAKTERIRNMDDNDINVKNQAYVSAISEKITSLAQRLALIQNSNTKFMKNIKLRVNVILNRIYHVHVNIDSINNNRTLIANLRNQITILTGERDNLINQLTQTEEARNQAIITSNNLRGELTVATNTIQDNSRQIIELSNTT